MAITGALYSTLSGLQNTEARIGVISDNVANADKPGYTRKELETSYISVNGQTVALGSSIQTVNYNPYLLETLINDVSIASSNGLLSEFLSAYSDELGTIDGNNSMSSYVNDLAAALDRLAVTPEDGSLKNLVVLTAERLANELRRVSETVQDYRLQADQEIQRTVLQINESVAKIKELNTKVVQTQTQGKSTANLEDDRRQELENLAELINIDYFINNNNEIQIYTGGRPLLDSRAREIEYTSNTALDANTLYPSGFNSIDLDGFDITTRVQGGELNALIELRDVNFVQEQAKLDEFALVMIRELNTILNTGASIPPPPQIVGEEQGLTVGTPLGGTGIVRIATTDNSGVVQNFADINLTALLDIGDLITAINTALGPDVTASLNADGQLVLTANNANQGISLNQMSSSMLPSGETFSQRFGLNNLFDGTGADDISVSDYLIANGNNLATGSLTGGAITIGTNGIFPGDSTIANQMNNAFTTTYSYNSAGNFAAQTDSLTNYVGKIISDVAYRASNARADADITISLMQQTKTTMQNISAVNIDEEMANLIDLEAKYEASATMIATIQEMFDALLAAVR